jgi:hypothetical protein
MTASPTPYALKRLKLNLHAAEAGGIIEAAEAGVGLRCLVSSNERAEITVHEVYMGLTISIPAELGEKLSKRATARGVPLEEYAREVLERDTTMPTLRELFAPVREQIEEGSATEEEVAAQIEEAVSEVRARRRG